MDANLHAMALLGLVPLAVLLIWFLGKKPTSGLRGFLAFLLVFMVSASAGPAYAFGPKVVAMTQVLIPAVVALVCAAFIKNLWARWGTNVALLIISMFLSGHFLGLVAVDTSRCQYTGHTGQYVSYRCNKPAEPYRLWHTWFTGIYGLQVK